MEYSLVRTLNYVFKLMLLEFQTGVNVAFGVLNEAINCVNPHQYLSDWATRNRFIYGRGSDLFMFKTGIFKTTEDYKNWMNTGSVYAEDTCKRPHLEITKNIGTVKLCVEFKSDGLIFGKIEQQNITGQFKYKIYNPPSVLKFHYISQFEFWVALHAILDDFAKTE